MQQQRHSLTVEIDDLEIFGANSQSVILVVRGYELVVVATHWESVRNAMLMCEKFSPFEVSGGAARGRHAAVAESTEVWARREGPLWAARNGWVGPPYLRANIAISCQPCASIYCSRWYVHAAQNEPIMNIFHCRGRGTSEHAETIWDPRGVDQAKAH